MELPEVEVVRRDLEKDVVGRRIREADVRPQRNAMRIIRRHARRKEFSDRLAGKKISRVDRKGKYVLLYLDGGDVLVVHFGMSGQLLRGTKRQALPPHTHVVLDFMQGGDLRFVDPRTFGEMFVTAADELGKVRELDHIAIDPLEDTFTWQQFSAELATQTDYYRRVVDACLTQRRCVGVTVWGFTDKYSWVPGFFTGEGAACLFDESFAPKPAYAAVLNELLSRGKPGT